MKLTTDLEYVRIKTEEDAINARLDELLSNEHFPKKVLNECILLTERREALQVQFKKWLTS